MRVSRPCVCAFGITLVAALSLFQGGRLSAQAASPQTEASSAPSGNAVEGKRLYTKTGCYECHGREAQGGGQTGASATGPRIGPNPIAYARFVSYLRKPTGEMPPYTARAISDQDLAHIYAFLQSQPRPPAPQTIPLLP